MPAQPLSALSALLLLAACGGGGGGPGIPVDPAVSLKLQAANTTIAAGATSGSVQVDLAVVPPGAVLMQFDVITDWQRLGPARGRAPLEALRAGLPVDGDRTDNVYRVLCGDARNAAAPALQAGPLLRLHFETQPPRNAGPVPVRIELIRAVDAAGTALPIDSLPVTATVTLQ